MRNTNHCDRTTLVVQIEVYVLHAHFEVGSSARFEVPDIGSTRVPGWTGTCPVRT